LQQKIVTAFVTISVVLAPRSFAEQSEVVEKPALKPDANKF